MNILLKKTINFVKKYYEESKIVFKKMKLMGNKIVHNATKNSYCKKGYQMFINKFMLLKTVVKKHLTTGGFVSFLLSFIVLTSVAFIAPSRVSALALTYKDNVIGYAENKKQAEKAKQIVIENSEGQSEDVKEVVSQKVKTEEVHIAEESLSNAATLSENIVDTVDELEKGFGIFIEGNLISAFKTKEEAEFVVNSLDNLAKTKYNSEFVSFTNGLTISEGNYMKETITNIENVSLDYLFSLLQTESYKYKVKSVSLKYDVVYVSNKDLSLGETNILSKGKKGICEYTYKFTFVNGVRTNKELINTEIIKFPKTRTIEVSQEEYNILMANKTAKAKKYAFPLNSNNYYVSSLYGYRWGKVHGGIDLAVNSDTEIRAYRKGTVITADFNSSYGNYIVIDHGKGLKTLYAHCNSLLADVGSTVSKGQIIALSGSTGNSTGPHLHFEVRLNDERVDPAKYIGLYAKSNKDNEKINKVIKTINLSGYQLDFINSIKDAAIEGYQHYNILPSLTLAQAVIESGWGQQKIGNNIFGIKAYSDWKGKKKYVWTSEERKNGTKYRTKAWFKDYDSIEDSVRDHSKLLLGERYTKVRQATNYREACYAVKDAGYATSSSYAETLINTIETYKLYVWDNVDYKIEDSTKEKSDKKDKKEETSKKNKKSGKKVSKSKKTTKTKNKNTKQKTTTSVSTTTTQAQTEIYTVINEQTTESVSETEISSEISESSECLNAE